MNVSSLLATLHTTSHHFRVNKRLRGFVLGTGVLLAYEQLLQIFFSWKLYKINVDKERKKEIWLSTMTKTPIPTENSKINGQHKNATKNFGFCTTISDRLGTFSWSNKSHRTGVVQPLYGYPTFPLTTKSRVIKRAHILKKVYNNPYIEWVPTANKSGEVIKMWHTNM